MSSATKGLAAVTALEQLIGNSESMRAVRGLIRRVARSEVRTVLVYGETGTGKGMVARLLHEHSRRAPREFVDINCAAIPSELVESELFGHESGAFTGARDRKLGLIEHADGGTVFLDEVRELNHVTQAKLLKLLDTSRFRAIGATADISVDVRFIAATNRILFQEVQQGHFRDDLYYRLQVVAINMPPLRERGNDCLILAEHFIERFNGRYGRLIRGWEPSVEEVFKRYAWPGNVRELEHLIERIFVVENDDQVLIRHIPPRIMREVELGGAGTQLVPARQADTAPDTQLSSYHTATAAFQRQLIERTLAGVDGSLSLAAQHLGLSRHALRHQMRKLGVR